MLVSLLNQRNYLDRETQRTPLRIAADLDDLDSAQALIDSSADVEEFHIMNVTALHHAAYSGSNRVARLLLRHGASLETKAVDGNTPLLVALKYGRWELTQLLLNNGASAAVVNALGESSLALMLYK